MRTMRRMTAFIMGAIGMALAWMIPASAASWAETEIRTAIDIEMMKGHPTLEKALRQNLTDLYRDIRPGGDAQAYAERIQETFTLLDQSLKAMIPAGVLQDRTFKITLLTRLLEAVGGEYEEAIQEGKVVNLVEYQDAYGFLQRAKALALDLLGHFKAEDRRQIGSLTTELEVAMSSIIPLPPPTAPETIKEKVSVLVAILKGGRGEMRSPEDR